MSKPKNMTPDQESAWREKERERQRGLSRKRRAANPDKAREKDRKWRAANTEKAREVIRKWYAANIEKAREKALKRYAAKSSQSAADQFFIMAGAAELLTKLSHEQA